MSETTNESERCPSSMEREAVANVALDQGEGGTRRACNNPNCDNDFPCVIHSIPAPQAHCGKATKYHLIAGASSYACMLPVGHDGECQPGGTCFKHGLYVGLTNGLVQCPKWPDCITPAPQAQETPVQCPNCEGHGIIEGKFCDCAVGQMMIRDAEHRGEHLAIAYNHETGKKEVFLDRNHRPVKPAPSAEPLSAEQFAKQIDNDLALASLSVRQFAEAYAAHVTASLRVEVEAEQSAWLAENRAEVDELRAEVERLRQEVAQWGAIAIKSQPYKQWKERAEKAEQRVAELERKQCDEPAK